MLEELPPIPWLSEKCERRGAESDDNYWNAAKLRRELYEAYAYERQNCKDQDNDYEHYAASTLRHDYPEYCFHAICIGWLRRLQQRAPKEIRRGVLCAVEHRLPMEMVDLIFEHALQAEDIPLSIRVFRERHDQEDEVDDLEEFSEQYRCTNMTYSSQAYMDIQRD